MNEQFLDCVGVPEFFVTHTFLEDAGHGMVRIIKGVQRNGLIIPTFSFVAPALAVLEVTDTIRDFSMALYKGCYSAPH